MARGVASMALLEWSRPRRRARRRAVAVGAGDPKGAEERAARLGVLSGFRRGVDRRGLMVARPLIAHLYSHDADVVELTSRCVPALALLVFFDAQNVCIQGTLSGAGAPQRIAVSNLVGWYVVGAPTALGLLFGLDLDAGAAPVLLACCGLALGTSFFLQLLALRSLDWDRQVAEAEGRLDEGTDARREPDSCSVMAIVVIAAGCSR